MDPNTLVWTIYRVGLQFLLFSGAKISVQYTMGVFGVYVAVSSVLQFWKRPMLMRPQEGGTTGAYIEAKCTYQDINKPFEQCLFKFGLQVMLLIFYTRSLLSIDSVATITNQQLIFFLCGIPIAVIGIEEASNFFNNQYAFWWLLAKHPKGHERTNWQIRAFLSWVVNEVMQMFVFMTLPLVLMSADSELEFVKDATAVLFITALDDLSEAASIELTDYKEEIRSNIEGEDALESGLEQKPGPKQTSDGDAFVTA